jgi:hypothetical protein
MLDFGFIVLLDFLVRTQGEPVKQPSLPDSNPALVLAENTTDAATKEKTDEPSRG